MNKRQRALLTEVLIVLAVTVLAVIAMVNVKDWINRTEAMRAMTQLGEKILDYRQARRSLPPKSFLPTLREGVEGDVRLGKLKYRSQWIGLDADPNEILAYTRKQYPSSVIEDGYVVLRLSGAVEWLTDEQLKAELAEQQSPEELEMEDL